jgi:transketolase
MGIEDVALACALPGMVVLVPSDEHQTRAATRAMFEHDGPVYMRVGRPAVPVIYDENLSFTIGKANTLREGSDITLIADGIMVAGALDAAEQLSQQGIKARVLDMATVKPLDTAAVVAAAQETGGIVVAEEHLHHGGLGSVVAMAVAENAPCRMAFVDIGDTFAQSGDAWELLQAYGLTGDRIYVAALDLLQRGK